MNQKLEHNINPVKSLQVLIVFKFQSEPQNFLLVRRVIAAFVSRIQTVFYFLDQNICVKMSEADEKTIYRHFQRKQHADLINFVFTVGGDGTILYAAKQFERTTPPFLTIQKGTLGFLCKFRPDDIEDIINKIAQQVIVKDRQKNKDSTTQISNSEKKPNSLFQVSKLMRLISTISNVNKTQHNVRHTKLVVNEVAITRKNNNRITLQISIDGQPVTTTSGDGILISTPTGSTAYALSAGGPVVLNGVNTILLVPIAPNSLSFRPICIPSTSEVKIKLSSKSKSNALVSFDGHSSTQITENDQICIWYEAGDKDHDLILYQPKPGSKEGGSLPSWMQRLNLFLNWNEVFKSPACEVLAKNLNHIQ